MATTFSGVMNNKLGTNAWQLDELLVNALCAMRGDEWISRPMTTHHWPLSSDIAQQGKQARFSSVSAATWIRQACNKRDHLLCLDADGAKHPTLP